MRSPRGCRLRAACVADSVPAQLVSSDECWTRSTRRERTTVADGLCGFGHKASRGLEVIPRRKGCLVLIPLTTVSSASVTWLIGILHRVRRASTPIKRARPPCLRRVTMVELIDLTAAHLQAPIDCSNGTAAAMFMAAACGVEDPREHLPSDGAATPPSPTNDGPSGSVSRRPPQSIAGAAITPSSDIVPKLTRPERFDGAGRVALVNASSATSRRDAWWCAPSPFLGLSAFVVYYTWPRSRGSIKSSALLSPFSRHCSSATGRTRGSDRSRSGGRRVAVLGGC